MSSGSAAAEHRPRRDHWWLFGAIRAARRRMWRRRMTIALLLAVVAAGLLVLASSRGGGGAGSNAPRSAAAAKPAQAPVLVPVAAHVDQPASWATEVNPGPGVALLPHGTAVVVSPPAIGPDPSAGLAGATESYPSPRVLATTDGGRSFSSSLATRVGFWGVDAAGGAGWAVGFGRLYRMVDGGAGWQRVGEPPSPLVRVAFANANDGFGLTARGRLVRSADGGRTWRASAWPGTGWAVCSLGPVTAIVATSNGGLWRVAGASSTRIASGYAHIEQYYGWWPDLSCRGANVVESAQALCGAACAGGLETRVRESTDGGLRWRPIADHGTLDGGYELPHKALGTIAAIAARGAGGTCLVGADRWVTIRCDGARNAAVPPLPGGTQRYPQITVQGATFENATTGWALVGQVLVPHHQPPRSITQLWVTHDGGRTWSARGTLETRW
jgi:hypothetical protein